METVDLFTEFNELVMWITGKQFTRYIAGIPVFFNADGSHRAGFSEDRTAQSTKHGLFESPIFGCCIIIVDKGHVGGLFTVLNSVKYS